MNKNCMLWLLRWWFPNSLKKDRDYYVKSGYLFQHTHLLATNKTKHHWDVQKVFPLVWLQLTHWQHLEMKEKGRPHPKVVIKKRSCESA